MPDDRITGRTSASARATPGSDSPGALVSNLVGDFTDLMQKEIALAKGEIQHNISEKILGSVWMVLAGVVFFVAFLTFVAAVVFFIATFGIAMHWSALIVTVALAIIGAIVMMVGKNKMAGDTLPTRSMENVRQDIRVVKEQVQ
ncbi:MAG: hypothetical protein JWN93_2892 [Hyphomicrobiales bacterium]|nr:hypothetical protein [Hyphomicrobiales bacterium]